MTLLLYVLKAWMIGIAIAAPVGPIGMLCIRKTLEIGLMGAMSVGLGAALADSLYGFIAGAGLTVISSFLIQEVFYIKTIGGVFLIYLAYQELKSSANPQAVVPDKKGFLQLAFEVFLLTLTNPMTIFSFIGIFATIGGEDITLEKSAWMVMGIFLGSMSWWLILGTMVVKAKGYLSPMWINRIRYFSAVLLAGFGVWAILSGVGA